MRHLVQLLASAGLVVLCTGSVCADVGDQIFKLLPNDGVLNASFGKSTAVSGITLIVGAFADDDNDPGSGSAYIFDITEPANPKQLIKLLPEDGAGFDLFGFSVGIHGTTSIIGAFKDDDNGNESGSAYLFNITTGQQIAKLLPVNGEEEDWFGYAVAISSAAALVGSINDDENARNSGAVYLFDTTTGKQLTKLKPDDGAIGDRFGVSIAINGNIAIIGAPHDDSKGSAYLFDISDPLKPKQLFKLLANDGAEHDSFGDSVAISGVTAIVAAERDNENGLRTGSAYLFDTRTGQQIAKLLPNDGEADDYFGRSVAISDEIAIVGANADDDNGNNSGSAYLFHTRTGQQIIKLLPDDGAEMDWFGWAVSINDTTAFIGAPRDGDNGDVSGSAYFFETRTIAPLSNFGINTGVLIEGNLPDLETSDNLYVHTHSGFGQAVADLHNMEMSILAEAPGSSPTTIGLTIESHIDEPAGLAQIRMKNFNTTEFDIVGSYSIGNIDAAEQITGIDASTYYNPNNGRMRVKIKHVVFMPFLAFTFESFIDQVEVVIR